MATTGVLTSVISVTIVLTLFCSTSVQGKNYKYSSSCYESPVKTLDMQCGKNEMLRIARAFYGYSPSGSCSYSPGDCTFDEHQNYACVGRQSCSINMPGGLGRPIPKCQHGDNDSNYFQVEYECVPVEKTINICKPEISTASGQSGYISSPAYPLNYDQKHQCTINIELPSRQGVRLYIVDMNLRELSVGQGCNDFLYISNALSSVTVCGQRGSELLFDSRTGKIVINFNAKTGGNNKGFWLYYEAYPPMDATTTPQPTNTIKTLMAKLTEKTEGENPIVESEVRIEHELQSTSRQSEQQVQSTPEPRTAGDLPFAAIVGGVIGSLCFILTILLILLVLQRVKERRDLEKKKHLPFLDVRNQAFQSNSELCPQDSNYC